MILVLHVLIESSYTYLFKIYLFQTRYDMSAISGHARILFAIFNIYLRNKV